MQFFSHPVVAVIILLGLLVSVHEMGHFVVGRMCGIAVEIFSIGFGPTIISWRRGVTEYRLSWIPLGGFVKFYGAMPNEEVPEELHGQEFFSAAVWKRCLTVAAGPVANFLLAVVTYAGMGYHGIPQPPAVIGELMKGSPAERAGLVFRDKVVAIDGKVVRNWRDLQKIIVEAANRPISVKVERASGAALVTVTPDTVPDDEKILRKLKGQIGISPGHVTSVVTVLDAQGAAGRVGILTGDRVVSVGEGAALHDVKYWREFIGAVLTARAAGLTELKVAVRTEVPDAPVEKNPAAPRTVVLSIADVAANDSNDGVAAALGITHGLLTVYQGKGHEAAPLLQGDKILKWNGATVADAFQLRDVSLANQKQDIVLTVLRQGQTVELPINLKPVEIQRAEGKAYYYMLPVTFWGQMEQPDPVIERYDSIVSALTYGVTETAEQTHLVFAAVMGLFTGDMPLESLGGPISIAKVASESVRLGWQTFGAALALISINLGLLNLFPIPVLDGGQLILAAVEGMRRRPLTIAAVENYQKIGFVMVMALVVMATYNDISRFWASMLEGVLGMLQ